MSADGTVLVPRPTVHLQESRRLILGDGLYETSASMRRYSSGGDQHKHVRFRMRFVSFGEELPDDL